MKPTEEPTLEALRDRIDQVDRELAAVLRRRGELILDLGRLKRHHGLPLRDPARERCIMGLVAGEHRGPYREEDLRAVFRVILDASLHLLERQATAGRPTRFPRFNGRRLRTS